MSAAQNAGGTCCVHMLCVRSVLSFSLSLKEASWHTEGEAEGKMLYCLKKKMHLLNELFPCFVPLVQTRVTVISE